MKRIVYTARTWTLVCIILVMSLAVGLTMAGCNRESNGINIIENQSSAVSAAESDMVAANWPIFRGDPGLSGVADTSIPDSVKLAWDFKTDGEIKSSPVIANGQVYFGSSDGFVYAVDVKSGSRLWAYDAESPVEAPPLVVDEKLYFGTVDGVFIALNIDTGKPVWKIAAEGQITGSANTVGSLIVFGSYDNHLYAVDAGTGEPVWKYESTYFINGAASTDGVHVVFGGCDAILHIINAEDGTEIGSADAVAYVAGSPALRNGRAYFGNYADSVIAVEIATEGEPAAGSETAVGREIWRYTNEEYGGGFFSSPAVTDDYLVIGGRDGRAHCLDPHTGSLLWTYAAVAEVDSSPVIAGDRTVFGASDGKVYCVDLESGSLVWRYDIGSPVTTSAAVVAGLVIVGSDDGSVYALKAKR